MRLEIRDGMGTSYMIDTLDLDMVAEWIMQTLARVQPTPMIPAMISVYPSWVPTEDGRGRPDWIADSRVVSWIGQVRTPREVLAYLTERIEQAEAMA